MYKLIRITTIPSSLKTLLKGQLRYMSQFFDVIAISSDGPNYEKMLEEQGVRGYKVNMTRKITPIKDIIALFKLICIFHKEKPDIVHTHTPKAGLLGMLAARLACVPCRMHTVAGLPLLVSTGIKRKILELVEKLTYACATNIYPNSFNLSKIIIDSGFTKCNKVKVIANGSSNGVDTSFFSPSALTSEEKNRFRNNDVFSFIFVGRVVKDKGVNELLLAFSSLTRKYNNLRLLLVGAFEKDLDPISMDSEKIIAENQYIQFVGFQEDVRPYMAASDVLILPSYREGFPNVVMQAGAMELPCIVTDINGCNEIIKQGINGVIIKPRNTPELIEAMEYFIANKARAKEMGEKARLIVRSHYERHIVWEALLQEYHRAIQK